MILTLQARFFNLFTRTAQARRELHENGQRVTLPLSNTKGSRILAATSDPRPFQELAKHKRKQQN